MSGSLPATPAGRSDPTASWIGPALLSRIGARLSPGYWLPIVRRLPRSAGQIGLSFDDGPAGDATLALLDVLRRHDASATFFVNGERAAAAMGILERVVAAGHDVFPHGWRHLRYEALPAEALVADLERCEALLGRLRPKPDPYLVRLPYGAGHMAPRLHRALRAWNPATQIAHWTVLTWDWTIAEGCSSRDQLARACVAAADRIMSLPGLAGSVLLLHEDPFDVGAPLAAEVAPILADRLLSRLRAAGLKGCTMVPIAAPTRLRRYLRG